MPDAERHDIPHHIVYVYKDEQGRRCTRFVADVVNGPQAVETSEQMVIAANKFAETAEQMADAFKLASGKVNHSSDCATSIAPAEEPGPCDCDAQD